jgi:hypothetical protein
MCDLSAGAAAGCLFPPPPKLRIGAGPDYDRRGPRMTQAFSQALARRLALASAAVAALATSAAAGSVGGKIELPPGPELPAMAQPGFVARSENAMQTPLATPVAPYVFVMLDGAAPSAPPQVNWDLVGESFSHPVLAAMAGAEVVIKNGSKSSRTLAVDEDPKLLGNDVLNPSGAKTIHVPAGKVYTVHDADAAYVRGRIVAVATPYIGYLDAAGRFEIPDVPDGTYKLRVYYKDGWLDAEQTVAITAKAKKVEVTVKVTSLKTAAEK